MGARVCGSGEGMDGHESNERRVDMQVAGESIEKSALAGRRANGCAHGESSERGGRTNAIRFLRRDKDEK